MPGSPSPDPFPNLNSQNHQITSPRKNRYNCIAWAAGCTTLFWWPDDKGFWPKGVPLEETLTAFLAAFATLGYEECPDGFLEEGIEKVVLYVKHDDASGELKPTHMARQLNNGLWTSKLGRTEDIQHMNVEDVSGPAYGEPIKYMRRTIQATPCC